MLRETIVNGQQAELQQATLALLVMLAEYLAGCPSVVFSTLIPPLLSLAGLPAAGSYQPATDLQMVPDLVVTDLAVAALSFMGKLGPAGLLLSEVRQHFVKHPEQLTLLARFSIENHVLLTLTVLPKSEEKNRQYKSAIERWKVLAKRELAHPITKQDMDKRLAIYQNLLDATEEVYYPSTIYLLSMLQMIESRPDQHWQQAGKDYLVDQLTSGSYTSYREATMLWTFLFPEQLSLQKLATLLVEHYTGSEVTRERYAKQLVTTLINDLSEIRDKDRYQAESDAMGYGAPYVAKMRATGYRRLIRHLVHTHATFSGIERCGS